MRGVLGAGSDVTRRDKDVAREACYSVAQLQNLLDEWLVHYHHRPHQGLRHPVLPKFALSPNEMWAALVTVAGYVPAVDRQWLSGAAAGALAAHHQPRHPAAPPHLRWRPPRPAPGAGLRCGGPGRKVGGPHQPARRPPDLGPPPRTRAHGDPVDPPRTRPPAVQRDAWMRAHGKPPTGLTVVSCPAAAVSRTAPRDHRSPAPKRPSAAVIWASPVSAASEDRASEAVGCKWSLVYGRFRSGVSVVRGVSSCRFCRAG